MENKTKPILLITYYWAPSTEIAVIRVEKLARYLRNLGWMPIILTVKPWHYEHVSNGKDEADFTVLRTPAFISPLKGYAAAKRWVQTFRRYRVKTETYAFSDAPRDQSFVATARSFLLSLLFTPDEFQGWLPFATLRALASIRTYNIRCVITSGPPFTTHLVGLLAKKFKGRDLKWIADFRDPWVANEQRPASLTSATSEYLNRMLEQAVISHADHVVCVTPSMTDSYRKRYTELRDKVWHTITNGFELAEFNGIQSSASVEKFTISYVGSIEYERSPEAVFRAIAELSKEGAVDKRLISLRLIGKCASVQGRPTVEIISHYDLMNVVDLVGTVPRADALKEMTSAHVLLLLANSQLLQVPGKAYEYIAARRFILALTEEHGATADLIKKVGAGVVVEPSDHMSLKRILQIQYEKFIRERTHPFEAISTTEAVREYEWGALATQYAELLG